MTYVLGLSWFFCLAAESGLGDGRLLSNGLIFLLVYSDKKECRYRTYGVVTAVHLLEFHFEFTFCAVTSQNFLLIIIQ